MDITIGAPLRCRHVAQVDADRVKRKVSTPSMWACQELTCATTEKVYMCLTCGHTGCSRSQKSHAENHFHETGHTLVLDINDRHVWCYACEDYVLNDNRRGEIDLIRTQLHDMITCTLRVSTTRRGSVVHWASAFQPPSTPDLFRKKDLMFTAVKRWRLYSLWKAFNKWLDILVAEESSMEEGEKPADVFARTALLLQRSLKWARTAKQKARIRPKLTGWQTGLRNMGNTCYMNSVLQCIRVSDRLGEYLLESQTEYSKKRKLSERDVPQQALRRTRGALANSSLVEEACVLYGDMWSGKVAVVSPLNFLSVMWRVMPAFKGYRQQDAQEFLNSMLQEFNHELAQHSSTSSMMTVVDETFQGQTVSEVTCRGCGRTSRTFEPFLDFPLDIPESVSECSILDCFKEVTSAEDLPGVFVCSVCGAHQDAVKRIFLHRLPRILCLYIKRFRWTTRSREKISSFVTFPLVDLDISPFCKNDTLDRALCVYELLGIINHHGSGFNSGHYTALCHDKNRDIWYRYNDTNVDACLPEDVQTNNAYILFYTRQRRPTSE